MLNKIEDKWLKILRTELSSQLKNAENDVVANSIEHIERVWKNVKFLGHKFSPDWEILIAAAFLHDIGRFYPKENKTHGVISAEMVHSILERINFPKDKFFCC